MIFTSPPSDFKKQVDVVGCYVQHDGKFLMLHRPPHKWSGNVWGLPAGKVDAGESYEEAICRELREETGIVVQPSDIEKFETVSVRHDTFDFDYHMYSFSCEVEPDVRINPNEHDGMQWVTPEEALRMPMVRDQDECVRRFYRL